MREILFRGKRTINGDWVEGNLFIPDKHNTPTQILIGTDIYRVPYDIIPQTVGQYTGLTDKNGKKIFEGDIVDFQTTAYFIPRCIVKYNEEYVRFVCISADRIYPMDSRFEYEVVGNEIDNPELMKGAEENA